MGRGVLSAVLVSALVGQGGGQADVAVERAGDWEALFDRTSGWTGADGRYVLVFQLDGLGRDVAARVGTSPVGPFGPVRRLWTCPEPDLDPDIYRPRFIRVRMAP